MKPEKIKQRGFEIITKFQNRKIILPERKSRFSAGYDISLVEKTVFVPGKVSLVPTGLKAYMLQDEYLGIFIRSGIALKYQLTLINGQGIIDADYYQNKENEGHIMVAVVNFGDTEVVLEKGVCFAQGIFFKYLTIDGECENLKEKQIRQGGFGSTDK